MCARCPPPALPSPAEAGERLPEQTWCTNTNTNMKMQNMNQSAAEIQVNPLKHWIHLDYMSCWFSKHLDDVIFQHSFEIACHLFNYYFLLLTQLSLLILASRFFLFCLFSSSCCCWQNLNNRQFKYNRFYEADRLQLFTESTEINSVIRTHMLKKIRLNITGFLLSHDSRFIRKLSEYNRKDNSTQE